MIYKKVFDKLLKKGLTIGFAESMTGGLCAYKLIQKSGASKIVKGSVVTYTNQIKQDLLGVDPSVIHEFKSVSKEVALDMALKLKDKINPDISVSVTGNAGPGLEIGSKSLEAYIAIIYKDQTFIERIDLKGSNRRENIEKTVLFIYQKIDEITR